MRLSWSEWGSLVYYIVAAAGLAGVAYYLLQSVWLSALVLLAVGGYGGANWVARWATRRGRSGAGLIAELVLFGMLLAFVLLFLDGLTAAIPALLCGSVMVWEVVCYCYPPDKSGEGEDGVNPPAAADAPKAGDSSCG